MRLLVIFLFVPGFVGAQLQEFLLKSKVDFSKWEDSSGGSKEQIVAQLMAEGHFGNYPIQEDVVFYTLDFDSDGRMDVICQGHLGGESKSIMFFRNQTNRYEEVIALAGELVYLSPRRPMEPLTFAINNYGCCSEIVDIYEYYVPVNTGEKFRFLLSQKIAHSSSMMFPKSFINPIAFETQNPEYVLRSDPVIDDRMFEDSPTHLPGNVLAIYPPRSIGTAIASETDSTGRVWYFVIMTNNIDPIDQILYDGSNNDEPFKSMGWMSSRFLEVYHK